MSSILAKIINATIGRKKYLQQLEDESRRQRLIDEREQREALKKRRIKLIDDYMIGMPARYGQSVKHAMRLEMEDQSYQFSVTKLIRDYHSKKCDYIYKSINNEINRPKGAVDFSWDVYTITYKNEIYIGITTDYTKRVHTQPKVKTLRENGNYIIHYHQISAAYAGALEKLLIEYYSLNDYFKCRNINPGGEFGKWGVFLEENDPRNAIDTHELISMKNNIIRWVEANT